MLDRLLAEARDHLEALRIVQAETILLKAAEQDPAHPEVNHLLGLTRVQQGRDETAAGLIEQAIAVCPAVPAYHHNIAGIYRRLGRMEDARRSYRRAIELQPGYGEAYQGLTEIVHFQEDDPLLAQIHQQLEHGNLPQRTQVYLHFAAGKIFDDLGRCDQAFGHYHNGNPRSVATASVWQVRQPIYTRSVGRWKHYESHLGPFLTALTERVPPADCVPAAHR